MVALPWASHALLPARVPLLLGLGTAVGGTLFVAGIAVWLLCLDVFSRRGRGTPFPLDAPRHLVTSGPFRVIRNPIMAAEIAVIWGEAMYFSSVGIFLYAAVITALGHLMVVYVEEPELRDRFDGQYERYCRQVPRWFPRSRRA